MREVITGGDRVWLGPDRKPKSWKIRAVSFLEDNFLVLCICLVGIACVRIISADSALSLTSDEPIHFACGMQYLADHTYTLEPQHPPLSRGFIALGPYLAGVRPVGLQNKTDEGYQSIARSGNVARTILLMRLGNLPFFVLACAVVCLWSRCCFGKLIAVIATGLFTFLPPVLADAGLATTDMALGATTGAAFLSAIVWAEKPTWPRTILLGVSTALAFLSKFTALGFLPAALAFAFACYLAVEWPRLKRLRELVATRAPIILVAAAIGVAVIWAFYWFSFGPVRIPHTQRVLEFPSPEFAAGIRQALSHDKSGHPAFLLGQHRTTGWWYYFPVAIAVKTPIAFLLLAVIGVLIAIRARTVALLLPIAFGLGVLVPAMFGRIDIGIRHIEPTYIGLSILAAIGLTNLLQWSRHATVPAVLTAVLVLWMIVSGAKHHPDYIAYFNEFASKNPDAILVDSNYDWGQDYRLLSKRMHELGASNFWFASSWGEELYPYMENWYHLPAIKKADDFVRSPGWTVVSPTYDRSTRYSEQPSTTKPFWYDRVAPQERVGVFRLYYTPPLNSRSK